MRILLYGIKKLIVLLDWDDLKGRLDRDSLVAGNLPFNYVEQPLIGALKGDWSRLLHEMFACRCGEYAQWSKEDWICYECWSSFFWDTMWRWRLVQKKRGMYICPNSDLLEC